MAATETRLHDAPALPCSGCGAPLPVDPTTGHAWCANCHAWRPVPDELRRRAHELTHATQAAASQAADYRRRAVWESREAAKRRRQNLAVLAGAAFFVLPGALSLVVGALSRGSSWASDVQHEYEPIAATVIIGGGMLTALTVASVAATIAFAFYRLVTRHNRRKRRTSSRDWLSTGREDAVAHAVCGVCGAPVAFGLGEQSVTCGHCRSTVVASPMQGQRLISLALEHTQLAVLEKAKAERAKILADLSYRRRKAVVSTYATVGALSLLCLPILVLAYVVRTMSRSVEQRMLDLARDLGGEFTAGADATFEWLDAGWLGETPPRLLQLKSGLATLFESRWSIDAAYRGRPVLVVAMTGWTDMTAQPLLLMARPRERSNDVVSRALSSSAAGRVRALGWSATLGYAGVTLEGPACGPSELGTDRLSALAESAFELCEER